MENKCPYCDGSGEKLIPVSNPITGKKKLVSEFCICKKSQFISDHYRLLDFLGGDYIPLDKIDPRLSIDVENMRGNASLIIKCPDYKTFCLQMKAVIMKHRFSNPSMDIFCGKSIEILQKYYVEQNDGFTEHLSSTMKFGLMIIELGTREKNNQLNTCIAEIVNSRKFRKPTWLYLPRPTLDSCKQEYSPELEEMLKDYVSINIDAPDAPSGEKSDLTDFGGLTR